MPLGFLRSRKDKEAKTTAPTNATVDEEFSENPLPSETFASPLSSKKDVDSFYSDSDTSDDDDTYRKPIRVVIKPINGLENGNKPDSTSELRQAAMSLSNIALGQPSSIPKPPSKRFQSTASQSATSSSSAITFPPAWQASNNKVDPLQFSSTCESSSGLSSSIASIWSKNESVNSNSMTRCKSYSSLTSSSDAFHRMTPVSVNSFGSSRGPSPFTIGFEDTVPLAVALQESITAKFFGTDEFKTDIRILGSLKFAFPSGIVNVLSNNPNPPQLAFKLNNAGQIEKIFPYNALLIPSLNPSGGEEYNFTVNNGALIGHLKKLVEQNPSARYYNLDILKYQLKHLPGATSCPLQVVSHWKCDPTVTGVKVEYKFNPFALSSLQPLKNVVFTIPIDASIKDIQGKPQPTWDSLTKTATWSYPSISHSSDDSGLGSLRAKFEVINGPVTPAPVTVTFSSADTSLSGIEFELTDAKYRISMVKKQVTARINSSTSTFDDDEDTFSKPIRVVIKPINGVENGTKPDALSELKQAAMSLSSVTPSSLPKPPSKRLQLASQTSSNSTSTITFPPAWQANNRVDPLQFPSTCDTSSGFSSTFASAWSKNESVNSNSMTRCKSYSSLTSSSDAFHRMTPVSVNSFGSSRGPSPFTIGFEDTVPLAVALQESITAKFFGTDEFKTDIRILGSLKIAFPSGIVNVLSNNPNPPQLAFKLNNANKIEKIFPNNGLLDPSLNPSGGEDYNFTVNTVGLISHLKKLLEQNPSARYYNLDILKYQLKHLPGATSCPLQVVSHWKCDPTVTGVKVEYKFNPFALSSLQPLKNVVFSIPIEATIKDIQGKPQPTWNSLTKTATWSYPSISHSSDDSGLGSLRAKFEVINGPVTPAPVTVTFSSADTSLSGIEFELTDAKYRISMVKKQVTARIYSSTNRSTPYATLNQH